MVSLVNFKSVNEDLGQLRQFGQQTSEPGQQMFIKVIHSGARLDGDEAKFECPSKRPPSARATANNQAQTNAPASHKPPALNFLGPASNQQANINSHNQAPANNSNRLASNLNEAGASFVVTWRNLKFSIEPKWHQNLMASGSFLSRRTSERRKLNDSEQQQQQQQRNSRDVNCAEQAAQALAGATTKTKVVLDKLDGSFRSGELTAILGPSGAGKTTLLDCLTGHRKHGLSGSIKISSATKLPPGANEANWSAEKRPPAQAGGDTNLKVSIIPQNDHLMGHLTVYETLNYASKMKNCFESKSFDHKLNIKRIAQQLGLITCLATRINKLSGGQYKRVSIAQELLSSPDILILDEPTSGLDAMTCYQTVQVLRKLTDDRQSQEKQIAVILTIHQPNSDVFQQFNHVYVVAQGGKCIYEGSPTSIESVINRIGLRLPNSYYNPATMIVEIAAGKFGLSSIQKLNSIQKRQYDYNGNLAGAGGAGACDDSKEEKTSALCLLKASSTGDSAVDCPSSATSSQPPSCSSAHSSCSSGSFSEDEFREVGRKQRDYAIGAGLTNSGFVMEADDNNESKSLNCSNVVVFVPKSEPVQEIDDLDSIGKLKSGNTKLSTEKAEPVGNSEARRKRTRRRTRKRSADNQFQQQQQRQQAPIGAKTGPCAPLGPPAKPPIDAGAGREKRLKLNSLKADQKFPFWRHTYLHFHRSWLSIIRDPMLCSMQLALHIIVPLMVSLVYGTNVGKPNACPRAGPMDIMAYALEPTDSALQLQEDLRTTLENIGYIFFKLYGIIFAAMTVTVLTFPLDMHVLVKEFRNGWYGLSSYFLGRTLADIPFQLTLPLLAMSLSYYATGQPYSYMQWRFLSITGILILSSLIAQSQGLLFGAILMDKMKAAVFVAPAATTPIILFAGFLVRTQSIPSYLRPLSNLSYLRYAIEACLISRYGFNQCECDPEMFNQTVPELPPIARSMLDYWLSSFRASNSAASERSLTAASNSSSYNETSLIETTTTTTLGAESSPDLFGKLMSSLARANSFGRNITSCEQVVPYPMIDYDLKDSQLFTCFAILLFMLVFTRFLTFFIVCFKVKRKV